MDNLFWATLLCIAGIISPFDAGAQATTVYLVRHAEKDLSDPNSKDPGLTTVGLRRSMDLDTLLADKNITEIFSTNTRRTLLTAAALSYRIRRQALIYDPADNKSLAERIRSQYAGRTVLIVGHSNTLLPLVQALGGQTSITAIRDHDYRYLFRLSIDGQNVKTEELTYGQ
jgi:2,3-bisphosphoglycerate-dependent phosphoglycerate mutase